jgi:predicted HNH restriction endonuclease
MMMNRSRGLRITQAVIKKGKTNYTESELILPALEFLNKQKIPVSTTALLRYLEKLLKPKGHDAELIPGRKDTYFSQKVRNLKSHDSLSNLNLAKHKKGNWVITNAGKKFLESNQEIMQSLVEQGFKLRDLKRSELYDYSQIVIEEGMSINKETRVRKRCYKLKASAVSVFKKDHHGKVFCVVCGFDFRNKYGEHGKDYIEAHHTAPIHEKDMKGEKIILNKAIQKIALVCSNCHRMIHRKKGCMLSVESIKKLVKEHCCDG